MAYSMKNQRKTFLLSMRNDLVLKAQDNHFKYFDQIGVGRKFFRGLWENTLFRFLFNILLPFGMLVMDIILPSYFFCLWLCHKRKKIAGNRFFLGHRRLLFTISKRANLLSDDDIWIKLLDDTFELPDNLNEVSVFDLIKCSDFFKSLFQSILIHIRTIVELGFDKYLLSIKSYTWVLEDYALRRLPNDSEILFEDICDRNAILFDRLPVKRKIMVQHGSMHFTSNIKNNPYHTFYPNKGFYVWNSLYKSSPDRVYCYTKDDEWALRTSVLANNPEFIYIGYGFKPDIKPSKKSVLIVGHFPLYKEYETEILKALQGLDIEIYLKNHPTLPDSIYNELRSKYSFIFISGPETHYPDVDLLISYNSTLAFEYASIGTKVLYYGQFDESRIREIIMEYFQIDK